LLMESVAAWSAHDVEVYGIDFAPGLVALARERFGERVWLADAATWEAPRRFDFVHVRLDLWHEKVLRFGRRIIVSSDGSFRRPESPKAEPVAQRLRDLGLVPSGEWYRRDGEHLVELAVAWIDQM
jgi:hypothetical protein